MSILTGIRRTSSSLDAWDGKSNVGLLLDQQRQSGHAEGCLCEEQRSRDPEEPAAVAGFEDVGEDSAGKGQEKRKGPESRLAGNHGGNEQEENCGDDERGGVSEIAGAAHGGVKRESCQGGNGDSGIGKRGKENVRRFERETDFGSLAAKDVAEGVRAESVGGEEDEDGSQNPDDEKRGQIGASALCQPRDEGYDE